MLLEKINLSPKVSTKKKLINQTDIISHADPDTDFYANVPNTFEKIEVMFYSIDLNAFEDSKSIEAFVVCQYQHKHQQFHPINSSPCIPNSIFKVMPDS